MSSSQILHSHCYPCGADVPKDVHDTVLRLVVSMNQERRTALHELYGHAKGIESLCAKCFNAAIDVVNRGECKRITAGADITPSVD